MQISHFKKVLLWAQHFYVTEMTLELRYQIAIRTGNHSKAGMTVIVQSLDRYS